MKSVLIAPSILAADPLNFAQAITEAEQAGGNWLHVDVMDGHFVPNLTFGLPLIRAMKARTQLPIDAHIMVTNPDDVALEYVRAGADIVVFHIEAARHVHRIAQEIQAAGARAGIALNPGTSLETIRAAIRYVDVVTVMSVNPGFGGQSYIAEAAMRIRELAKMIHDAGRTRKVLIQVDGGINDVTAQDVCAAGANVLVMGTYFYDAPNKKAAVAKLLAACGGA